MKEYLNLIKLKITSYIIINWNSGNYYGKGKIIFIGIVIFFMIWKAIYSIFN